MLRHLDAARMLRCGPIFKRTLDAGAFPQAFWIAVRQTDPLQTTLLQATATKVIA
jgi:hypothetical protein